MAETDAKKEAEQQAARQAAADVAAGRADDDALDGVRKVHVRANAGVLGLSAGQVADVPYDPEVRALLDNGMIERVDADAEG